MIERCRVDRDLGVGIPEHEIGIVSGGDRALPALASPASVAGLAASQRVSRCMGRPRARMPVQTTDSAICNEAIPPHARTKSPSLKLLERRRRRRMIGGDEIDRPVHRAQPRDLRVRAARESAART